MKNTEKKLIYLLYKISLQDKVGLAELGRVNWQNLLCMAREQQISPLIYTAFKEEDLESHLDKNTLKQWRMEINYSRDYQRKHIKKVEALLQEFESNKIPVIALKGLVVRRYYEEPELRTMSDADLLVLKKDLARAAALMVSLGYYQIKEENDHGAHITFKKDVECPIEIHWTLCNKAFYTKGSQEETELWSTTMEVPLESVKVQSLGLEDLALHLCQHMAVHLAYKGFGIRQIFDLALLINKEREKIQWLLFIKKVEEAGISRFVYTILNLCKELFKVELPKELERIQPIEKKYRVILLEDIFSSGLNGVNNTSKVFANEIAFQQEVGISKGRINILKKYLRLLFPKVGELGDKYNYAKKHPYLTIFAWIHHLFSGIFRKDYSMRNKIKIFTTTMKNASNKNSLLKALKL